MEIDVAAPLLSAASASAERSAAAASRERGAAARIASIAGYTVTRLPDGAGAGHPCWVLAESISRPLGWGVLAVREGASAPVAFEAPMPRHDGAAAAAADLFRATGAAALLLADAELPASTSADADPARFENSRTVFEAFHQAIHRSLDRDASAVELQVRALGTWSPSEEDLVIGLGAPQGRDHMPARMAKMLDAGGPLRWLADSTAFADGDPARLDQTGAGNPAVEFSRSTGGARPAILWISARALAAYEDPAFQKFERRLESSGIAFSNGSALEALLAGELPATAGLAPASLHSRLDTLAGFARSLPADREAPPVRAEASERQNAVTDEKRSEKIEGGYSLDLGMAFYTVEVGAGSHVLRGLVPVKPAPAVRGAPVHIDAGDPDARAEVRRGLAHDSSMLIVEGMRAGEGSTTTAEVRR
jgi:hypothetical protein